jgi:hypothetical protein
MSESKLTVKVKLMQENYLFSGLATSLRIEDGSCGASQAMEVAALVSVLGRQDGGNPGDTGDMTGMSGRNVHRQAFRHRASRFGWTGQLGLHDARR